MDLRGERIEAQGAFGIQYVIDRCSNCLGEAGRQIPHHDLLENPLDLRVFVRALEPPPHSTASVIRADLAGGE